MWPRQWGGGGGGSLTHNLIVCGVGWGGGLSPCTSAWLIPLSQPLLELHFPSSIKVTPASESASLSLSLPRADGRRKGERVEGGERTRRMEEEEAKTLSPTPCPFSPPPPSYVQYVRWGNHPEPLDVFPPLPTPPAPHASLPPALSLLHPLYAKQRREIHSSPFSLPLPLSLRRRWLGRKREAHSNINQLERRRAGKRTGKEAKGFINGLLGIYCRPSPIMLCLYQI